ncbi:hypothetical protein [Teichococcus aestuarii]|uniref:hypothetical protein n=1 Tax=Teichococcus aestuarii TaxID=568898 RepID=UPI003614E9C0
MGLRAALTARLRRPIPAAPFAEPMLPLLAGQRVLLVYGLMGEGRRGWRRSAWTTWARSCAGCWRRAPAPAW